MTATGDAGLGPARPWELVRERRRERTEVRVAGEALPFIEETVRRRDAEAAEGCGAPDARLRGRLPRSSSGSRPEAVLRATEGLR